jgi:hypothetical protein
MSLTDFRPEFDNSYQELFQKTIVSTQIMNTRFEARLRFGESVERVKYSIDAVKVRDVTRGAASTIDVISDSPELLEINIEREAVFHISDGEVTQAGPLNPGEVIGGKIGHKVALDLDARCFGEVVNAANTFDNGDLTTLSPSGTPITLTSTTVPQMVTRMPAKLRRKENQTTTGMVLVADSYAMADIEQYLLAKDINLADSTFVNGYAGPIRGAVAYVSEALTGEVIVDTATQPANDNEITIGDLTWTFKTTLGSTPGNVLRGADADAARANFIAAVTGGAGAGTTYVAFTGATEDTRKNMLLSTVTYTGGNVGVRSAGSGRLEAVSGAGDLVVHNFIHAYYGKRGAIDLVVQDMSPVDMRQTDDRRGTNVFSSYLAGIKTFSDGAVQFLDVWIKS